MSKKVILLILDGWGHGKNDNSNAIYLANTPFVDSLYQKYPNSELITFGEDVGLPVGQMGNSEVGHLNIGAGRIVYQDFAKINKAIRDQELEKNTVLLEAIAYAKENNKPIHLMGLVSNGGIHSHQDHLVRLCEIIDHEGIKNTYIHAFTDGRDTDPNGGVKFLSEVLKKTSSTSAKLASIIGRYYAMDRDKRWERVKEAYDLLVNGIGKKTNQPLETISEFYQENITDEFLPPIVCVDEKSNDPIALIKEDDVVICFNFRTDRCREITEVLTQKDFLSHGMKKMPLHYVTMTNYDNTFKDVQVLFEKDNLKNTIGEVVSDAGLSQIRMAETEKYPHVTFFFSGGREEPFKNEKRIIVNSPKVATYDLQPEMSAHEVTSKIVAEINSQSSSFICLNFANPDMVGHTGDQQAIIKAVETIDACTKQVVETGIENDYQLIVIADHGNAEKNKNEDGSPHTAHTTNLVPCFLINTRFKSIANGKLADVAPTILQLLDVSQPPEMTGVSLLKNN